MSGLLCAPGQVRRLSRQLGGKGGDRRERGGEGSEESAQGGKQCLKGHQGTGGEQPPPLPSPHLLPEPFSALRISVMGTSG